MSLSFYAMPQRTPDEAAREAEILRSGVLSMSNDVQLNHIVQHTRAGFGTDMAALTIVSSDWVYIIAAAGLETGVQRRSTSFCGHAILSPDRVFCVSDAAHDDRFSGNPDVEKSPGLRFYAGRPITSAGVALGALCILHSKPRAALDTGQERALESLATLAMATVRDIVADRDRAARP